jgi:hypothetical protein
MAVITALAVLLLPVLSTCLNPVTFNPDNKLDVNVSGELSIDQINSSEIQVRNHTKSLDIYDIKFREVQVDEAQSSETRTLSAQISGAPTAGTQESIFLRPWKKYEIELKWREAKPKDAAYNSTTRPDWDWGGKNPDRILPIDNLPRGKYVIHVYRKADGGVGVQIEDAWQSEINGSDHHHDADFTLSVKPQINVDLSGLSVDLNMGSAPIPVVVGYTPELLTKFDALIQAIKDGNKKYPNGYGFLIIDNHTGKALSSVRFTRTKPADPNTPDSTIGLTTGITTVRAEDQEGILLSAGTWDTVIDAPAIGPKNAIIGNQGKSYLHIYEKSDGTYGMFFNEQSWNINIVPADAHVRYRFSVNVTIEGRTPGQGYLIIHNKTKYPLNSLVNLDKIDPPATGITGLTIQANEQIGGEVDKGNWKVSIKDTPYSTQVFVVPEVGTHVYYYQKQDGSFGWSTVWPPIPNDAAEIDDRIPAGQGILAITNNSQAGQILYGIIIDDVERMATPDNLYPKDSFDIALAPGYHNIRFIRSNVEMDGPNITRDTIVISRPNPVQIKAGAVRKLDYTDALGIADTTIQTIDYEMAQNGVENTQTTTKVALVFQSAVVITLTDIQQVSPTDAAGAVITGITGSGTGYTLAVNVQKSHVFTIRINKAGIVNYEHQIMVYKQADPAPPEPLIKGLNLFPTGTVLFFTNVPIDGTDHHPAMNAAVNTIFHNSGNATGRGTLSQLQEGAKHAIWEIIPGTGDGRFCKYSSNAGIGDDDDQGRAFHKFVMTPAAWSDSSILLSIYPLSGSGTTFTLKVTIPAAYTGGGPDVVQTSVITVK